MSEIKIPKVIHVVWVGDQSKRPDNCIDTWRKLNPSWEVKVWTDEEFKKEEWVNKKHMDAMYKVELNGVADMMRYEILYKYGGFAIDADAICVRPLDDALFGSGLSVAWENEEARPGLYASGFLAAPPGNPFLKLLIDSINKKPTVTDQRAWITVASQYMSGMIKANMPEDLTTWPSYYFIPNHFSGKEYQGDGPVYSRQLWGSTFNSYDGLHTLKMDFKEKPTICLTMIVKNEESIIEDMLKQVSPFINYWVIVDTGSTDKTKEVIKKFFDAAKIPGELHERPWVDFGHNRTEAMQLADGKADYMWVMDADDGIDGVPPFKNLMADVYAMRIGKNFSHWRHQLFKSGLDWKYKGVLHEYAFSEKTKVRGRLEGDYFIIARTAGARNSDPKKYENDAKVLEEALKKEPNNERYWFYLGQSYFDSHNYKESKRAYAKRVSMGKWNEEQFYAQWRVGLCAIKLAESDEEVVQQLLRAYELRPNRAEPLFSLAEYMRSRSRYAMAYMFAKAAAQIPFPKNDVLFIYSDIYSWRALDETAVNAFHLGKVKESFDIAKHLVEKGLVPPQQRERITKNLHACAGKLGLKIEVVQNQEKKENGKELQKV